jgi:ATP-dependent DNA helicase RecG
MVIQHAERFGLATLHQLRGRVGRSDHASVCLLVAEVKGGEAQRRIKVMTETTDGFRISEEDLSLRGPGEVLGVLQHGVPEFQLGDLVRDARLIHNAREAAKKILDEDPALKRSSNTELKKAILKKFGQQWALGITA